MLKATVLSLAGLFLLSTVAYAGEKCAKEGTCPTGEKITKLLASWKAVSEEAKSQCPEEKAKLQEKLASVAKECPVGSRLGRTIGFARTVLAAAVGADEACAKSCPLSGEGKAVACPQGATLKAARSKLIRDLHQLASYAVETAPGACAGESACCAREGATAASVKAGAKDGACCLEAKKDVATSAKGTAAAETAGFCAKKAGAIVASVRGEACDKGAAAIVLKGIEGLKCETKAGAIVAAIRAEACADAAAQIVVKAANELKAACAKDGATTTAVKADFCAKKAGAIVASVRGEACDQGAAAIVLKEIEGLKCEKKAGAIVAAIRAEACADAAAQIVVKAANELQAAVCAKEGSACASDLLAGAAALKTSWGSVGKELASMCPQKRQELGATFASLAGGSKTVALMPETVLALADGFDALDELNGKLTDWAKANPGVLKDVPEEAKKAFASEQQLLHETREVLGCVRAVMKSGGAGQAKAGEKTASAN